MGRKSKVSCEDMIKVCEDYWSGKASHKEIAKRLGFSGTGHRRFLDLTYKYREY